MRERACGVFGIQIGLAERKVRGHAVDERLGGLPLQKLFQLGEIGVRRLIALELRAAEDRFDRERKRPLGAIELGQRVVGPAGLHEHGGATQHRVFGGDSGQRNRFLELVQRLVLQPQGLAHLREHVVRLGVVRRERYGAARRLHGLIQMIQLLERARAGGQATGMQWRKGRQRVQPAQGFLGAQPGQLDAREIQIGVRELRIDIDRAARRDGRRLAVALVVEQTREIAVTLGILGTQCDGPLVVNACAFEVVQAFVGVAEIVVCFGRLRGERQHALERDAAVFELAGLLLEDAEVVPGRRQLRIERHGMQRRLLTLAEQAFLTAHLREIAVIRGRRPRRLAGLAQMRDREIQIAVRVSHEPEQMQRVGLTRPDREHALAPLFRLIGLSRIPMRMGFGKGLLNVQGRYRSGGRVHRLLERVKIMGGGDHSARLRSFRAMRLIELAGIQEYMGRRALGDDAVAAGSLRLV